jgi:hypothetical protein
MGRADRLIRLAVAGTLAGLFLGGVLTGTLGVVAIVISGIFIVTSLVSFCPMYALLGVRTCKS